MPTLTWNRATFATSYDVYLAAGSDPLTLVANVPADLTETPPLTYSYTPGSPLAGGTTYTWQIVSRTFATPTDASLVGPSEVWTFTTTTMPEF
jgi:hypothetical protein